MTGADLTRLRWAWSMGSVDRIAARLGCHPVTIRRSEARPHVTRYVQALIDTHPTCPAFLRGMAWGEHDSEYNSQGRIAG